MAIAVCKKHCSLQQELGMGYDGEMREIMNVLRFWPAPVVILTFLVILFFGPSTCSDCYLAFSVSQLSTKRKARHPRGASLQTPRCTQPCAVSTKCSEGSPRLTCSASSLARRANKNYRRPTNGFEHVWIVSVHSPSRAFWWFPEPPPLPPPGGLDLGIKQLTIENVSMIITTLTYTTPHALEWNHQSERRRVAAARHRKGGVRSQPAPRISIAPSPVPSLPA